MMMHYLKILGLAYLLSAQPISTDDLFSEIKQIINDDRHEYRQKGCTPRQRPANCTFPADSEETRPAQSHQNMLPHNTECVTYDGCYTCKEGSWVTSSCIDEHHHREKRWILPVLGIIVIGCLLFCGDGGGKYTPPEFTNCAGPASPVYTPRGKRAAVVQWQTPSYKAGSAGDPKLQLVSTTGDSRNTFKAGHYTITYHLVDNQGYTDSCSFSFQVKVRTCPWPDGVRNGYINCGSGDIIYGDQCHVSCNKGYHLDGRSTIKCEANEKFNAKIPSCLPKQCSALEKPAHSTGFRCTDGVKYHSVCTLICDSANGYSSSPRFTLCQDTQAWRFPLPECKDTQKPKFTNCPAQAVQTYSDRGKTTTVVTWKPPTAVDNSGDVTVEQVDGLKPGQTFSEGSSTIKYTATDPSGHTAVCTFAVNVIKLFCEFPNFNDSNLVFDCKQGYSYGSQCSVSCKTGLPLNGTNTIVCEKDNSIKPVTYWDLGGEIPPYCIKRPCEALSPPKHGALSCDTNMGGTFCVMSCQKKWDIPRSAVLVQMYSCGWSVGKWMPTSNVPDCTAINVAKRLRMKSELYYYSGNCGDPNTLAEIKLKFVKVLDNSGLWKDGCPCTVENVNVICGEASGRKKRTVNTHGHILEKRSTVPAAIITWSWVVPIQNGSVTSADTQLIARAERMLSLVQNSELDIGVAGFEVKPGSFGYDESQLDCPPGYLGTYRTGTCSPCPTGMMYSPTADDCIACPPGTYQDEEGQFQCKQCPAGTKTIPEAAKTLGQCTDLCRPGHYSKSGVVPCDACPVGKYQPDMGSTDCLSCGVGTTTSGTASTSRSACQSFDLVLGGQTSTTLKGGFQTDTDDLTISMWLQTGSAQGSITIRQPDGTVSMELTFGKTLSLSVSGSALPEISMPKSSWFHLSVVYNHGTSSVVVYKNGVAESSKTLSSVPSPVFKAGSKFQVKLKTHNDITIRSVFVISSALSKNDVLQLSSSCEHKPRNFVISISDLVDGSSPQTAQISLPTACDAVDECEQSSPCNGHTCVNLPGSYRCECQDGYSGSDCSVPPDFCADNKCEHGKCETGHNNYTCSCYHGYTGPFCDTVIVNGGWGNWAEWDQCSLTCGGGIQRRRRRCDNPSPKNGGKECIGSESDARTCNTMECPACRASDVRRGVGSTVKCNGTSSALDCIPVCTDPSHVVDVTTRFVVRCTNGEWDSDIPKVASCTKTKSPAVLRVTSTSKLNTASCLSPSEIRKVETAITNNLSGVKCNTDASCHTRVTARDDVCGSGRRRRRSLGTTVTITLSSSIADGDLQLAAFRASKTVSPQLQKVIDAVVVLEKSAQQLQNESSIFDVTVDGTRYSAVKNSAAVTTGADCPAGAVVRNMLCVYCSPGSYVNGERCEFCGVGTYQDEIGKSECKTCPPGKSTQFTGSSDVNDCTVTVDVTTPAKEDKITSDAHTTKEVSVDVTTPAKEDKITSDAHTTTEVTVDVTTPAKGDKITSDAHTTKEVTVDVTTPAKEDKITSDAHTTKEVTADVTTPVKDDNDTNDAHTTTKVPVDDTTLPNDDDDANNKNTKEGHISEDTSAVIAIGVGISLACVIIIAFVVAVIIKVCGRKKEDRRKQKYNCEADKSSFHQSASEENGTLPPLENSKSVSGDYDELQFPVEPSKQMAKDGYAKLQVPMKQLGAREMPALSTIAPPRPVSDDNQEMRFQPYMPHLNGQRHHAPNNVYSDNPVHKIN